MPILGERRWREDYLWFPKTLNGDRRWFSHERWQQIYKEVVVVHKDGFESHTQKWVDSHWSQFR